MAYPPQGYGGSGGGGPGADTRGRTIVVAASNSVDPTLAPAAYRCDGVDDQVEINAAITALGAIGGTVILLEGTYNITASINLSSNTTLMGQGAGTVLRIPDGHNADLNVISAVSVTNVLVADLHIDGNRTNQGAGIMNGIYFDTVTFSKISHCWVENMYCPNYLFPNNGIYLHGSSENTITGNTCQGNWRGNGIQLDSSSDNAVTGNVCYDNWNFGIYLYSSIDNSITGNTCGYNTYGINISDSSENTITGNTCSNNNLGINLDGSSIYNTVTGNTCQGNAYEGISLYQASDNTITGNTCIGNLHAGINLENNSNNNTLTGNTCNGNHIGFNIMSGSSNNTITGNTADFNDGDGIDLDESDNNTVTGNTCQGNGFNGIYLVGCSNNTISSNTVVGNSQDTDNTYFGIHLEGGSNYNSIQANTVRHAGGANQHKHGIDISDITCTGNLVINNDLYQAGRTADYNNAGTGTIYHNNRTTTGWVP